MILEGFGQKVPEHIFNAKVCSKNPKRNVIERSFYTLFLYNDRAYARCMDDEGGNVHIQMGKEDLTRLFLHKIAVLRGLIQDKGGQDLNEFYNGKPLSDVTEEIDILGDWFLEVHGYSNEEKGA